MILLLTEPSSQKPVVNWIYVQTKRNLSLEICSCHKISMNTPMCTRIAVFWWKTFTFIMFCTLVEKTKRTSNPGITYTKTTDRFQFYVFYSANVLQSFCPRFLKALTKLHKACVNIRLLHYSQTNVYPSPPSTHHDTQCKFNQRIAICDCDHYCESAWRLDVKQQNICNLD